MTSKKNYKDTDMKGSREPKTGPYSESFFWDSEYANCPRIWGDRPSELALIAVKYLLKHGLNRRFLSILDIGCGYGRDSLYLAKHLNCNVNGIDISQNAIEISTDSLADSYTKMVQFTCCNFMEICRGKYDIVFVSNLYQLLHARQRDELRKKIVNILKPQGLLFLNSLSVNDPEDYGKGEPYAGEEHSFSTKKFLHFCTREELESDFQFISIKELYEHEYTEPRDCGLAHHHISWILIGQF